MENKQITRSAGIIIYECTSNSSNIRALKLYAMCRLLILVDVTPLLTSKT